MGTYDTIGGTPRHDPMFDQDDGITELQDKVLELLEAAGIPTATNDKIMDLICEAEQEKRGPKVEYYNVEDALPG